MTAGKKKRTRLSETLKCSVAGCGRPHYGRGFCNKHYQAARARGLKPKTPLEAFNERLGGFSETGCRLWLGVISANNQAKFFRDGETLACRWGYKNFIGPLGDNEVVRHICDNGACVNPGHWIKGSQADNIHDAVVRARTSHGSRHYRAKLTEDDVREIRSRYEQDPSLSYDRLGKMYGVSGQAIRSAVIRRTWRRVA